VKFFRGIFNGLKRGYNIQRAAMALNNQSPASLFIEGMMKFVRPFIKSLLASLIALVLVVIIIVEGFTLVTEDVKSKFGILDNKFVESLLKWVGVKDDKSAEELLQLGCPVNIKKIPKYVEIENKSYPTSVSTKMTVIKDGQTSTESYTLDLSSFASKYRLPWQFIQGLDVINNTADKVNDTTFIDNVKQSLSPTFTWGYDKYTKDVTDSVRTWKVKDGSKEEVKETYTTKKIPLALPDKVESAFKTYTFSYSNDVTTRDTGWGEAKIISERSWTTTHHHKNADGTTSSSTEHHTEKTYQQTKETVVEDIISNVTEAPNTNKLSSFLNSSNIPKIDLELVSAMLEEIPDCTQIKKELDDILNLDFGSGSISGIDIGGIGGVLYTIPRFYQYDSRWAGTTYGDSTIGAGGCGPTSFAMVSSGINPSNLKALDTNGDGIVDPVESANYSVAHGYKVTNNGTDWEFFKDAGSKIGLTVTQYTPAQYIEVLNDLKNGYPVIASMTPGHFTKGGHFICLTGVDSNGQIIVNDPASEERSNQKWDFASIIVPEAAQFWSFKDPNIKLTSFLMTVYGGHKDAMEGLLGVTADGTDVNGYVDFTPRIIAVDPSLIPLGSVVYIQFPADIRYQKTADGKDWDMNGWYVARDTGGAIKGNHIDLFCGYGPYAESMMNKIGTRNVNIRLK